MSLRPSQRSVFTSWWRSGPPRIWMSSSDVSFLAGSTALCAELAEVWSIFRGWIGVQSCVRRIMIRRRNLANAIRSVASGPEPVLLQKLSPWQWWWWWCGWSHSSSWIMIDSVFIYFLLYCLQMYPVCWLKGVLLLGFTPFLRVLSQILQTTFVHSGHHSWLAAACKCLTRLIISPSLLSNSIAVVYTFTCRLVKFDWLSTIVP